MQYVQNNENNKKLKIVNIKSEGENNDLLIIDLKVLDRAYPEIDIEFIELEGVFGPSIIDELSENGIFQKTHVHWFTWRPIFSYRVAELGGVRLIM
jgi:hypothetical protein